MLILTYQEYPNCFLGKPPDLPEGIFFDSQKHHGAKGKTL